MIKNKGINKIIYFDKETIRNILQEQNKGSKTTKLDSVSSTGIGTSVEVETKVKLSVPFWDRLSFLFSGRINASFMFKRDSSTTITSTEISEFEQLKLHFTEIKDTLIFDIENSSTFFRVAGGYLRIIKGGVEGVDIKEFKSVMDDYDGYDTYKVDDQRYVRFNNSAFVSNYKRNDLLATRMTLYCIDVGKFDKEKFDFFKQISKMENLITGVNHHKSLADAYPPTMSIDDDKNGDSISKGNSANEIQLFDVVYACITMGGIQGG
ncbi:DUF6414 family protein [Paenibacillus phoenicis]|uniref:DUF6414 family protein n=1 Tax=Paenibacillus phoenicis TaxID=554117 RepID=A0ABU5PIL8_9BACL|nr:MULTISPECIES: DUF6414 family protein [Paenibacillus]MCT2196831.1 DUF6414 family protein [Paenibacillus sp. p3-SID1389]MEA3569725.1 DUF6414 family protein [Paenibacillus phoenicis]